MKKYYWSSLTSDGNKVIITCHPITEGTADPIELELDYSEGDLQELISTLKGIVSTMDMKNG